MWRAEYRAVADGAVVRAFSHTDRKTVERMAKGNKPLTKATLVILSPSGKIQK